MLEVSDLHAYYGRSHVVQGISLSVAPGEAVALMGRNGVGKTTSLKSIMGMETRTKGRVLFEGKDVTGMSTHARAARGLGYVPEERAIFPGMTVEENIRIGAMIHQSGRVAECVKAAFDFFPLLGERRAMLAGTLSGGQQKMLALARALALKPRVLLVDEPTEGLMPANAELMGAAIKRATDDGLAVLVVDSSFDLVKQTCQRLYAMDRGVLTGTFETGQFSSPDELAARYLGGSVR